VYDVGRADQLI